MNQLISDKELIAELEQRFQKNEALLLEQFNLMLQLKTVNERLVISEGLKSNFLSNIRNEINNPLASILEMSKNISEGTLDVETTKRFSGLIYSETFNLDFQLRNIFASAEIESGEVVVSPVAVNIPSVLENVILSFKHLIEKKNLKIYTDSNLENHQRFCTDSEKLHLILSNLISNAIQFNKPNGSIKISLFSENDQLTVAVLDSGIGIQESEIEIIFDRFRQLEEGSTKAHGGHGLGLSITKALLELLGGEIKVESEKNNGSLFSIFLTELIPNTEDDAIFSSDGNDFLFTDSENSVF